MDFEWRMHSKTFLFLFFSGCRFPYMPFLMSNYLRTDKKHWLWFSTDFVSFFRQQRQKKINMHQKKICQIGAITLLFSFQCSSSPVYAAAAALQKHFFSQKWDDVHVLSFNHTPCDKLAKSFFCLTRNARHNQWCCGFVISFLYLQVIFHSCFTLNFLK